MLSHDLLTVLILPEIVTFDLLAILTCDQAKESGLQVILIFVYLYCELEKIADLEWVLHQLKVLILLLLYAMEWQEELVQLTESVILESLEAKYYNFSLPHCGLGQFLKLLNRALGQVQGYL